MKKLSIFLIFTLLFLTSCSTNDPAADTTPQESVGQDTAMKLKVDDTELDVDWEDNESIRALKQLCKTQPLMIEMSRYSDFEQVGSIGEDLPSEDIQMTTEPGDIVLYESNQLVIFFGSNTWDYTKLGHISGSSEELRTLLNRENVEVQIYNGGK